MVAPLCVIGMAFWFIAKRSTDGQHLDQERPSFRSSERQAFA
jgi:hypothetical protein